MLTYDFDLKQCGMGSSISLKQSPADPPVHQSGELEKLLVKEGLIPELPVLPEDQK